jgi:GNAT superfamily N-acetyltransferase
VGSNGEHLDLAIAHGSLNNWGQYAFKFMRDLAAPPPSLLLGAGFFGVFVVGSCLVAFGLRPARHSRRISQDRYAAPGRRAMKTVRFETRRADPSDAEAIGRAHVDSIRTMGPGFYAPPVVNDWAEGLAADVYVTAMAGGEVFFIAVGELDGQPAVLGFASDYRVDGTEHGTSVYVRGVAARQGIGSALLRLAEAEAAAKGATSVRIEASLAGVEFYKANGYEELARGETRLRSGRPIACVLMRKVIKCRAGL